MLKSAMEKGRGFRADTLEEGRTRGIILDCCLYLRRRGGAQRYMHAILWGKSGEGGEMRFCACLFDKKINREMNSTGLLHYLGVFYYVVQILTLQSLSNGRARRRWDRNV